MSNAARWALVVPVAAGATALTWAGLALLWKLLTATAVVAQGELVSAGIAEFAINALAAGSGVLAGVHRAPTMRRQAAVVLAAASTLFAVAMLAFGAQFRATASPSLALHIWSTFAWMVGAVLAVAYVWKRRHG